MHLLTHCDVEEFRKLSPDELQHLRQLLDLDAAGGPDAPDGDSARRTSGGGKEVGQ